MKKLIKFYLSDLRKGLLFQWKRIAVCGIIIAGLLVLDEAYLNYSLNLRLDNSVVLQPTLGDLLLSLFAGIDFYYPGNAVPFSLPVAWMFLILMIMYLALDYPTADLNSVGVNSLVLGSSRNLWWFSKCLWVISTVLVFCAIILLLSFLVTVSCGGALTLVAHSETPQILAFNMANLGEAPWDTERFLFSIPIILVALALVQLFLSQILRPIPGFACLAVLVFLSAYYDNSLLLGEYLMAARSSVYVLDGFSPEVGSLYAAMVGLWAALFGALFFSQQDILGKDQQ